MRRDLRPRMQRDALVLPALFFLRFLFSCFIHFHSDSTLFRGKPRSYRYPPCRDEYYNTEHTR